MNLGDIREYLNTILNKHNSGNSFSPDEFNYVLKVENINFFNHKIEEMQNSAASEQDFREMLLASKLLRPLLASQNITPTIGVYNLTGLSNTFAYWGKATTIAVYHGGIKRIELVNHNEYELRQVNILSPPIYYFPIAEITGDNLNILPTDITQLKLTYIKLPSDPVFDYYIDANRNIVYLTEGQDYTLQANEVYSDGTDSGDVSSTSNELDYGVEYYSEFIDFLLSKLGLRNREPLLFQASESEKLKDSAQ